ncbi:MAG: ATP-grasp domain-containing protein [Candidatus Pacebacteria bacterium]|nr:ATP-grasp domain-containing protein [Candidatus Paceibacterota bacterium]
MYKPCVGVLRGGPSSEYSVSLKTGQTVLQHLSAEKYNTRDILIDKSGAWHLRGMPIEPARALDQVDVVFNALHGAYGEDGTVQRMLDTHGVRYTGSGALGSGIAMNKVLTKRHLARSMQTSTDDAEQDDPFEEWGIRNRASLGRYAPRFFNHRISQSARYLQEHRTTRNTQHARPAVVDTPFIFPADVVILHDECTEEVLRDVLQRLSLPFVVKPATGGSSIATSVVSSFDDFLYAVLLAFEHAPQVLVEQFVRGREVTVAVVEDFRDEELYAFPPIEIRPTKSAYFDYAEKYEGHAEELCPAPLPSEVTKQLLTSARNVHRTLGLRDYSRSDFILGVDGLYFLEVNTLPGLTPSSLLPKALEAVGATMPYFLEHVTTRALARR